MRRLTTRETHPHGAEGISEEKLSGKWCRGKFEATAIVEKLARYENLEEDGKLYVCDDIIYPKMVSRLFGIDMKTTIALLEDLSKKSNFGRGDFCFLNFKATKPYDNTRGLRRKQSDGKYVRIYCARTSFILPGKREISLL